MKKETSELSHHVFKMIQVRMNIGMQVCCAMAIRHPLELADGCCIVDGLLTPA